MTHPRCVGGPFAICILYGTEIRTRPRCVGGGGLCNLHPIGYRNKARAMQAHRLVEYCNMETPCPFPESVDKTSLLSVKF